MHIRLEMPADVAAVHAINQAAFETSAEADLVDSLRVQAEPIISLVADDNGTIVGHILFSPVTLTGHGELEIMGFAPMAVLWHSSAVIGSARPGRSRSVPSIRVRCDRRPRHPKHYPRFACPRVALRHQIRSTTSPTRRSWRWNSRPRPVGKTARSATTPHLRIPESGRALAGVPTAPRPVPLRPAAEVRREAMISPAAARRVYATRRRAKPRPERIWQASAGAASSCSRGCHSTIS
jgi:putative acetyltransferase